MTPVLGVILGVKIRSKIGVNFTPVFGVKKGGDFGGKFWVDFGGHFYSKKWGPKGVEIETFLTPILRSILGPIFVPILGSQEV